MLKNFHSEALSTVAQGLLHTAVTEIELDMYQAYMYTSSPVSTGIISMWDNALPYGLLPLLSLVVVGHDSHQSFIQENREMCYMPNQILPIVYLT